MIDLHSYTNHSLGAYTDEGTYLRLSNNNKLFTVTDYFNISGHLRRESMYDISGVEVSACFEGYKIDLLLYGFIPEKLKEYKVFQKKYQFDINTKILALLRKRLRRENIIIPDLILDTSCNVYLTVYQHLVKCKNIDNRFSDYQSFVKFCFNPKYKVYTPRLAYIYEEIPFYEKLAKDTGALLFLSDLTRLENYPRKDIYYLWDLMYYCDGLECMNNNYTEEQTRQLLKLCKRELFFGTMGTSYDGYSKYVPLKTLPLLMQNNYGSVFNWINDYTNQEIFR